VIKSFVHPAYRGDPSSGFITVSESWLSKVKAESRPHLNLKKMTIISWPLLTKTWNKESLEKLAWLEDILDLGKIQCVR